MLVKSPRIRLILLQLFRGAIITSLALLVHAQHLRLQIEDDMPVTTTEVQAILPDAARLELDAERMGLNVYDAKHRRIGYAVRTMPVSKDIVGYSGPTDAMLVFDPTWVVRGTRLRSTRDTPAHFMDVANDRYFMKSWEGKTWDEIAGMDLKKAGVEGVSGATLTSMAVARGYVFRLKSNRSGVAVAAPPMTFGKADAGLLAALVAALLIAFTPLRGVKWVRGIWQIILIAGVGLLNGQLLAVSLFGGWAASGVAWRNAPGLALLAALALLVPWVSKKALYCQYFCPHGAAQEWIHRLAPKALRINLPPGLDAGMRWLPGLLLLFAMHVTIMALPVDLTDMEPFDAYVIRAWSWTMGVLAAGLLASIFVPMAYCKFGCPTGALLEFIRSRGPKDHFGKREVFALVLLAATLWMFLDYYRIRGWISG